MTFSSVDSEEWREHVKKSAQALVRHQKKGIIDELKQYAELIGKEVQVAYKVSETGYRIVDKVTVLSISLETEANIHRGKFRTEFHLDRNVYIPREEDYECWLCVTPTLHPSDLDETKEYDFVIPCTQDEVFQILARITKAKSNE
jgi:hypothetical protein